MNMPLVSIVIPIYNGEKTIARCLKSILRQTYNNLEIICVNDGSKDKSLEILEFYQSKDNRIKVINQENKGTFIARKNGIINASGKYLLFSDADDTFPDKNSTEALVSYVIADKTLSLVQFASRKIHKYGIVSKSLNSMTGKISISDFYQKYAYCMMGSVPGNVITFSLCNKLFITDILKSVISNVNKSLPVGEDAYLNLLYLDNPSIENILIINDVFYNYYQGIGVMSRGNPWKALVGYSELKELQISLCDKWNLEEKAKEVCHMETVYYRFCVVKDEYFNKKRSEEQLLEMLAVTNECEHFKAAKNYYLSYEDKIGEEIKLLITASPKEYLEYVKNNCTKPDGRIIRKIKSILKLK